MEPMDPLVYNDWLQIVQEHLFVFQKLHEDVPSPWFACHASVVSSPIHRSPLHVAVRERANTTTEAWPRCDGFTHPIQSSRRVSCEASHARSDGCWSRNGMKIMNDEG